MDYILWELLISIGKMFIFTLFVSTHVLARDKDHSVFFGVSQVFKAQIYESPDVKSKVIAYLKKGEKVKVHNKHFNESTIAEKLEDQEIDKYESKQGFYHVITPLGDIGFIEKNHLHLIYRDFRDQHYHFQTSPEKDLTDYRLIEPLEPSYPLSKKNSFRLNLQARLGPGFYDNYVFPTLIKRERFSNRYGAAITFLKNANFDFEDRFYFGAVVKFLTFRNEFILENDSTYLEDHLGITIGPTLYYESLRLKRMTIGHGLELNAIYRVTEISAKDALNQEKRKFDGYMLEPAIINQMSFQNLKKNLDFNLGMRISARPKYTLKSKRPSEHRRFWGGEDGKYEMEAKVYQTYFIGIQIYH